jgi:hypothetical protein
MLYTNRSIIMINSNKKLTHIEWQELVREQEISGQSQREFCSQRGLVLSQFVYYRCNLKNKDELANHQSDFKPVKVISKDVSICSGDMKLTLPNGFQCEFPCQIEPEHVKRLIQAFLSC